MTDTLQFTFWGTRGSMPVTGSACTEFGGDTTCFTVEACGRTIVLDAGTGLVKFGKQHLGNYLAAGTNESLLTYLFHTHAHLDHVCGFQYFAPLYHPNTTTYIYGPTAMGKTFEEILGTLVHPPLHPVPLREMPGRKHFGTAEEPDVFYFVRGREEPLQLRPSHAVDAANVPDPADVEVTVRVMRAHNHPKSGVLVYRIEALGRSVVLATDVEGYEHGDQRLIEFARNADVLVHDAMYYEDRYLALPTPTQGWGHSTIEMACATAAAAEVGALYLTHHDPSHTDEDLLEVERHARAIESRAAVARDGLVVSLEAR